MHGDLWILMHQIIKYTSTWCVSVGEFTLHRPQGNIFLENVNMYLWLGTAEKVPTEMKSGMQYIYFGVEKQLLSHLYE